MKTLLGSLAVAAFVLGLVNFVLFATTGDAAVPVYVSHPLGMVAGFYLLFGFVVPTMLGRHVPRVLPPAGPPVATFRSSGRVGRVGFSGKLLKVTVYADRLTLRAMFLGEYTIHGSEIRSIAELGGMMFRRVRIEHAGPGMFSRVTLYSVPDHAHARLIHVNRDPLPRGASAPAEDEAARAVGKRFTSILFGIGLVLSLGFAAFGAVLFARYRDPFLLVWTAAMLVGTFVIGREFVKFRRRT